MRAIVHKESDAAINSGLVRFPFSNGKHAPIAAEDQARLIAAILASPEAHAGKTYNQR